MARSHSESSEPATKVRNSGVKVGSNEWSKSETSRLTNFETASSLLPSVSKEARGCSETSRDVIGEVSAQSHSGVQVTRLPDLQTP